MEKFKVSFTADNQQLKAIGTKHASDTYADIEATFVLGERWVDMDSVSAVWWNDFTRIATVLDPQGKCIVPHEVLTRKGCVRVNLVGSVMEGDELVTRLTSYSAEAVQVNEKIKLTGSETSEITPSQFEQFVAVVIAEVEKVTGMTAEAVTLPAGSDATAEYSNGVLHLGIPQGIQGETGNGIESVIFNSDYSLTFDFTDGTEFTTPSIRGADGNGIRSIAKTGTSGLVDTYTITFDDGSTTTYTVTNGAKGDKGDTGATPSFSIGTVETLEPTEDATATITGTAENPVLNLGIPQGKTGEVTYEDLESILPRDTASGQIASFPDGQSVIPLHSLKVSLEPIQPCTPWMGSEEYNNPYLLQAMPSMSEAYNTEYLKKVVGGTVVWNQYVKPRTTVNFGIRATQDADGVITLSGTALNTYSNFCEDVPKVADHKYLVTWTVLANPNNLPIKPNANTGMRARFFYENWGILIGSNDTGTVANFGAYQMTSGADYTGVKLKINFHDITQMFGTAIADYIYNLNSDGIAFFKSLFPNDYYPYNSGELLSVQTSAHVTKDGNGQQIASYPLDSSLTLRGIPKLDAQNNLYYDGDEYKADGSVARRYGIVDLGTLTWYAQSDCFYTLVGSSALRGVNNNNLICPKYAYSQYAQGTARRDKTINVGNPYFGASTISIKDTAYSSGAELKASLNGVMLVYELVTPTTESASPYTSQQSVDDGGTEEFVSANVVPVGHVSSYARVCPISGHTEVNTHRTGVNVWDEEWEVGGINTDGSLATNSYRLRSKNYISIIPNTAYYFASDVSLGYSSWLIMCFYDGDKNFVSFFTPAVNRTFNTPSNARFMKFCTSDAWNGRTYEGGFSINYPSTDTEYHAYEGDTYTTSLGQTVYGGTLDVVSGELVVDRKGVTFDGSSDEVWSKYGTGTRFTVDVFDYTSPTSSAIDDKLVANYLRTIAKSGQGTPTGVISGGDTGYHRIMVNVGVETIGGMRAYLTDNPLQVVYPLATPQTIQLTPTEVRTLLGTNNVWSDGDVVVVYSADTALWIEKKLNA